MKAFDVLLTCSILSCYSMSMSQDHGSNLESYKILIQFIGSGYMGDIDNVQIFEAWKDIPCDSTDTDSFCTKITYTPAKKGWAGVYWLNRDKNWGDFPGENLSESGFNAITFWARGDLGREVVEFKAGGINTAEMRYRDSFTATTGSIVLDRAWRRYSINLGRRNLSSVIGGFCWVGKGNANPNGLTFYLDNVHYVNIR